MAALKARVDTLHGSVLEALDTAKAIADEAAKRAAEAAKSAASAATGGAVDPEKLGELLERAVKAASAAAAAPKLTEAAKSAVPDKPAAPAAPKVHGSPEAASDRETSTRTGSADADNDSPTASEDHVLDHLRLLCAPGASLKPVLIKGEAGAGKTYSARIHGREFDRAFEIALNAETEAADLLGYSRVDGSWQDGPLSQAFRSAASGYTTQLRLDEYYRPRNQARSILFTCTSPFVDLEGKEFYVLTTGRAIPHPEHADIYEQETLYAPCHLLAIVGTTNVGSQYDVSVGDPAEKRRFAPVHIDVTEPIIRRILGSVLADPKHPLWGIREALIDGCVGFWRACRELRKTDRIEIVPTVSTFCEALKHPAVRTPQKFSDILLALGLHVWVGEDLEGSPIPEQVSSVTSALRSSLAPIL
jgi:MoxR-like ATPase